MAGASETMTAAPVRGRFQGMTHVLQYNWPFYLSAVIVCAVGVAAAQHLNLPRPISSLIWLGVDLTAFWSVGSALITFYVYDVSPLYRWTWLTEMVSPNNWVAIHAGLDETSPSLRALFPNSRGEVLDIYDSRKMTEPSIDRARSNAADQPTARAANLAALPLPDSGADTVFLIFAAHEIRDPEDRVKFFKELHRVVDSGGRVVLVEHLRDIWNFIAYGPGVGHFFARSEWLRVANAGGFTVQTERSLTPFVRCFVFKKAK